MLDAMSTDTSPLALTLTDEPLILPNGEKPAKPTKSTKAAPRRIHFTTKTIAALKPQATEYKVVDAATPGFYVVTLPSGTKSWMVMLSIHVPGQKGSKARSVTFGRVDRMTLAQARAEALRLKVEAGQGIDPKADARKDPLFTFNQLCDRFLARLVALGHRPGTIKQYTRLLNRVRPAWGERDANSITKKDINQLIEQIAAKRLRPYAPAPDSLPFAEADSVLAVLKAMFRMAKKFDWTEETDPARDVPRRGKSVPRERALTDEELVAVYHACDQVIGLPFGAAFQIALLTGQRMGEVCGLPWSEIDFASKAWSLPAERAKNRQAHRIHLSEPVLAILDRIRRHDYYDKKFVFPRQDGLGSVVYWTGAHRKLVKHLDSTIGPRERWTPHDLRRTMATGMAELGVDDKYIEMALNHEPLSPLARTYNKAKYWPQQADAHNLWGAHVAKLVHALDVASDERQP